MLQSNHIAKFLLFSYAIILAHNIIPHHHHWEPDSHTILCPHEHQDCRFLEEGHNILDNKHNTGAHTTCQFKEQSLHSRSLILAEFYGIAEEFLFSHGQLPVNKCFEKRDILIIDDPGTLSLQKRGPPCLG